MCNRPIKAEITGATKPLGTFPNSRAALMLCKATAAALPASGVTGASSSRRNWRRILPAAPSASPARGLCWHAVRMRRLSLLMACERSVRLASRSGSSSCKRHYSADCSRKHRAIDIPASHPVHLKKRSLEDISRPNSVSNQSLVRISHLQLCGFWRSTKLACSSQYSRRGAKDCKVCWKPLQQPQCWVRHSAQADDAGSCGPSMHVCLQSSCLLSSGCTDHAQESCCLLL